ncbi:MAG: hypothetical protein J6Y25_02090 [Elusimicrobiaceae bacterium]|nr:hypothetical protein [Elusimicrobiaceae bacterium]
MRLKRLSLFHALHNRRAQLLLPAALLLPIFVLVIYLLVEVTKVSIAKVRNQFALDNAAYSQMSTVSLFLNATAYLNGGLPFRVLSTYADELKPVDATNNPYRGQGGWTVFDLFYQAGAVPSVGPDYDKNAHKNPAPSPASTDWKIHYAQYSGIEEQKDDAGNPAYVRSGWEKETPDAIKDPVWVMNREMVEKHYIIAKEVGIPAITAYLSTYVQLGDTFNLQKDLYKKLTRNAHIFREGYYLNVDDCKKNECARQSASRLLPFLNIPTKRQEADDLVFHLSAASNFGEGSGGAWKVPWKMTRDANADPLFFFAYVEPSGRSKLRTLKKGISLKQNFKLPRNHFNINLESKYKPAVRNTIVMSCPRGNNNCVWPNPIPKYTIMLRP